MKILHTTKMHYKYLKINTDCIKIIRNLTCVDKNDVVKDVTKIIKPIVTSLLKALVQQRYTYIPSINSPVSQFIQTKEQKRKAKTKETDFIALNIIYIKSCNLAKLVLHPCFFVMYMTFTRDRTMPNGTLHTAELVLHPPWEKQFEATTLRR